MTFQVGIVGTDGVLLAGDRRYTDFSGGYRAGSHSSKILTRGGMACCSSGGPWASDAADCCIKDFKIDYDVGEQVFAGCRSALEQLKSVGGKPQEPQGSILFVCRRDGRAELWFADVKARRVDPVVPFLPMKIESRKWIGDLGNAAVFFLERYVPDEPASSVDDLKLVAAHSVLMAGKLNPAGVSGLEMLICRDGHNDCELITGAQLDDLKSRSGALDAKLTLELRGA